MANKDSEILPATCDFNDFVSLYLESCEPFSVIYPEPYPCINLDEPNLLKTDALTSPYDSTVVSSSSDYRDNDGKFSGNEIDEVKRLSNRRSTRKSSLYKKNDTKLTARKSKRYFGKRPTLDLLAADVGRGQRSNLVRYARPSTWGLVDTIDKIFKQNAEMYVDAKGRAGRKEGKSITDSVSQSIQTSQVDSRALNKGSLVVKLKIGAKAIQNCHFNTIPDLEKDLDSYRDVKLEASMLQRDIKDNYEKQVSRASNENPHKHLASSKLSVSNVLHTERERSEIPKMKGIGNSVEISCLDPGTSPDTEVVNVIPHVQVSGNTTEGIRVPSKLSITHQSDDCYVGSGIPSPEIVNHVLSFENKIEGSWSSEASMPITTGIASCNASSREACPVEPVATLQETEVGVSIDMLTVESVTKAEHSIAGIESVDLRFSCQHFYKSSKSKSSVNKNRTNCRQKGSPAKSTAKGNAKEKSGRNLAYRDTETHPVTGCHELNDARGLEEDTRRTVEPIFTVMSSEVESRQRPPPSAWVCCDDCHKWRRISAILADVIESTECRWICKENMDKAFADCSIPQEKSNADINEELELSEASCEEDACNTWLNSNKLVQKQPADPLQPSWKLIKTNMFLHRNRKNQPIDEIMVCHCKPPVGGHMGCRDECLNRMLNIECVKGTCPCGDFCSNQQFQKRKYSKMKYFPSGKKGYGLQLLEDIPKGRFLIEYVGEVLDMPAYEARQRDYASQGHEHFYFMTLNGSEVIDACAKGNLGRFINHSCEPNCRTEKWMVNGEVCIGFFAIRDIKKGEELTFDYNYVRVFGAAAKKCVCGSSRCRGVIGGDPQNDERVVLSESDAEYPKPAMFYEKSNCKLDDILPVTQTAESTFINNVESDQSPDSLFVTDEKIDDSAILIESTEREVSEERSSSATSESESKKEHTEGLFPSFVRPLDTSFKGCDMKSEITKQNENRTSVHLVHEDGDPKKKTTAHTNEKKCTLIKEKSFTKLHSSSSALKKEKFKSKQPEIDSKPLVVPEKPKKLVADNLTGRFEAVEEALNSLLTKGGISKRKDAWKGYLTLLCLTANGGNGEGIQSNRDLSMILDALLRTKSRTVLLEIINKNGLQMLHILLKRYREVFNKTPILRKLLKVFEFLAETKILALENILKPSLHGVESFKDSILSFTEHEDKEVHQIARHFRDRYIPWSARRVNRAERDTEKKKFQQNSNLKSFVLQQRRPSEAAADNCIKQSISGAEGPPASCLSTDGTKTRKRKSRWDQPGDVEPPSKREFGSNNNVGGSQTNDGKMDADSDAPGFSSPVNHQLLPSNPSTSTQTVKGQPQGRYSSRLPTAFGVPCSLLKNVGTPKAAGAGAVSWIVAPGMTFLPFPPLPVYPRDNNRSHVKEQSWRICNFQRDRNGNTLGKRYFRQQKWNYSRPGHHNKYGPAGFGGSSQNRNQR